MTNGDNLSQRATLAGGCFWCLQGPFDAEAGVTQVRVGYAGGTEADADYYRVAGGLTEHRESVDMVFDPEKISFKTILDIFWRQIDPTDPGGQFADRGQQYMTTIYYHTDEQRQIAEASKQALQDSGKFDKPIATEILPFVSFFEAEEEHQSYYKKSPLRYQVYKKGSGRTDYLKDTWNK
ncbi:MAG: peptide-methionine (S)-S-oxide reductase [Candidatus Kerfeldbacteria bacterium CG15_BIG_FIL_POST_REV_8_21_14_020_45_12]|uniref:Peptide methionine sulfoxide reductase MsrA n=1 Tax=Candidatus Kerfeldbacteria bacterium CG15_BIG_FIL_POST_REV_8_21_14_020_45_12 TaxID=2014247 RepID=A0A2M7H4G0_9BACT|nr:MAG: peptide-methionine (S)-S-oxide reductase [Candidatus Kerfeldbacteria bacterium CG15_BIG_FIL_POST_REV_8_21_14_020_45_12]PJA93205.1 MAG: peptide-methionine (S)-S-oxide reductase [Candidatus Kerfeldbacteria bacterium CG_4_9_14_3_um_filter_45_8]